MVKFFWLTKLDLLFHPEILSYEKQLLEAQDKKDNSSPFDFKLGKRSKLKRIETKADHCKFDTENKKSVRV